MANLETVAERYRRVRTIYQDIAAALGPSIPPERFRTVAASLGLGRDDLFGPEHKTARDMVGDTAAFGSPPALRALLDTFRTGREEAGRPNVSGVLAAVERAFFGLLRVEERIDGTGARVYDLLTGRELLLADVAMSGTVCESQVFAARLIPFDEFCMSSGAALPVEPETLRLIRTTVWDWRREGAREDYLALDAEAKAELATRVLAVCIGQGALEHVRFLPQPDGPTALDALFTPSPPYAELPWQDLSCSGGDIPWDALQRIADALAGDAGLLGDLGRLLAATVDHCERRRTYEPMYVPAVIALAADRLDEESRHKAARTVLEVLRTASIEDEDVQDSLICGCWSLGPGIVPDVLAAIPADREDCWLVRPFWRLLALVGEGGDDALRRRVVARARDTLAEVLADDLALCCGEHPGGLLVELKDRASLTLLRRIAREADAPAYEALADDLASGRSEDWADECGRPVEDWLSEHRDSHRAYLDEEVEDFDEEGVGEAAKLAGTMALAFLASRNARRVRNVDPSTIRCLLEQFVMLSVVHLGRPPGQITPRDLRTILEEVVPAELPLPPSALEDLLPVLEQFLPWMQAEGIVGSATPLLSVARRAERTMLARAADPGCWSEAKTEFIDALRKAALGHDDDEDADWHDGESPFQPRLVDPITNESPKVGRNDPCPCGSGRKYKKCCGP